MRGPLFEWFYLLHLNSYTIFLRPFICIKREYSRQGQIRDPGLRFITTLTRLLHFYWYSHLFGPPLARPGRIAHFVELDWGSPSPGDQPVQVRSSRFCPKSSRNKHRDGIMSCPHTSFPSSTNSECPSVRIPNSSGCDNFLSGSGESLSIENFALNFTLK